MTFAIRVKGGTGAGRKRPLKPRVTDPWRCPTCKNENRSYFTHCQTCRKERPHAP